MRRLILAGACLLVLAGCGSSGLTNLVKTQVQYFTALQRAMPAVVDAHEVALRGVLARAQEAEEQALAGEQEEVIAGVIEDAIRDARLDVERPTREAVHGALDRLIKYRRDQFTLIEAARTARERGATRFCMGAAYRNPKPGQLARITEMVRAVRGLGLVTCATLGMLTRDQAEALRDAGLDYYNHNLDTSEAFYPQVISTRTYADRLDTLKTVRDVGLKVCCGGIIGLGEADQDRIELLHTLATLPEHPESVPVNQLVQVAGTGLNGQAPVDPLTFVRVIAVGRILMPKSRIRLSAGRSDMSDELQALCFFAGANSIFYGERLLTTPNPGRTRDDDLFARLGLAPETAAHPAPTA